MIAAVLSRLVQAMNRHDAAGVADQFAPEYRSEQPLHPGRGFGGSGQVLKNWIAVFAGVPDFSADVVASSSGDDTIWAEMRWQGTYRDGSPFLMRGVTVLGLRADRIAWARLYMEPVQPGGGDIESAVRDLYRAPGDRS
jgi:hypothetical protein